MKKILSIISVILCFAVIFSLAACTETKSEKHSLNVACLKGPTGVGMAQLMSLDEKEKTDIDYDFTVASSADEISGQFVSGEINIACIPTNLASKLYSKTSGRVTMLAVNTLGVLSVVGSDTSVKSVSDLSGKTIYATGEGSNPEYILRYILTENGINPDTDLTLRFVATNDELTAEIMSGNAEIAMIAEPAATVALSKKSELKRLISLNDEWDKTEKFSLTMGCVVALTPFIEENPKLIEKFLKEYEASISYATENTKEAAELCEKYEIIPSAAIAVKAIPNCNLTFISGDVMEKNVFKYLNVLLKYDSTSVGGALPDENFYYKNKK